jgi:uncharacterized protein YutE (UPF0331/DUF86 family)
VTDRPLLLKKLSIVETCVAELRRTARPTELRVDIREQRFVEHTLQIAIQAALDVASHIVSDERLGEPRTKSGALRAPRASRLAVLRARRHDGTDGRLSQRPRARL